MPMTYWHMRWRGIITAKSGEIRGRSRSFVCNEVAGWEEEGRGRGVARCAARRGRGVGDVGERRPRRGARGGRGATWPAAARGCGCFEDLIGWGRGGRGRIAAVGVNRVDGWMDGWTCSDPWCWPFWGWGWGWSTTDLSVSVTVFFGHLIRRCLDHSKSPHFLLFLYSSLFFWGEGSVGFFFL